MPESKYIFDKESDMAPRDKNGQLAASLRSREYEDLEIISIIRENDTNPQAKGRWVVNYQ